MELREVIEKRASVRKFKSDPVKAEDLKEMVRLAGLAPSVNNSQPWRFIAITSKELLSEMKGIVSKKIDEILPDDEEHSNVKSQVSWYSTFFSEAPAVIAVVTEPYEAVVDRALPKTEMSHKDINIQRGHPDIQSVGAAIQNMLLAAVDLGYGACWLSGPLVAREGLEACLKIEKPWKISAMIAVGKEDGEKEQKEKKPLDNIFELRS